jgi:hypothetical protein
VRSYRVWTSRYAERTNLDAWYANLDAEELLDLMSPSQRRVSRRTLESARAKNHMKALAKMTVMEDGRRRIVADPSVTTQRSVRPPTAARSRWRPLAEARYRR